MYEQLKSHIFSEVEKYKAELIHINDDIADHPELSGKEYETSKKLVELLLRHGYNIEYPFEGIETAFRGIYGNNNHKNKIAILVEYDALPGLGHACGHCLSGSISILAGLAIKDLQDALNADIHLIGTPNEEEDGAKCILVEKGIFNHYDMAIMAHMYNKNLVMPKFQALVNYTYHFQGKAAHASAAPWEGRNALNGVQLMLHAIDMLRQHTRCDAQFHSVIRDGGNAPNIVPEHCSLEIYIRAEDKKYLEELIEMVDNCAEGAAIATQTEWKKTAPDDYYYVDLKDNKTGEKCLREVFQELNINENAPRDMLFGSSDIGNVSYACPAFHPCLQVVDEAPLHTKEFEEAMKTPRAHNTLAIGAKMIACHIAKIFSNNDIIAAMKADFDINE